MQKKTGGWIEQGGKGIGDTDLRVGQEGGARATNKIQHERGILSTTIDEKHQKERKKERKRGTQTNLDAYVFSFKKKKKKEFHVLGHDRIDRRARTS